MYTADLLEMHRVSPDGNLEKVEKMINAINNSKHYQLLMQAMNSILTEWHKNKNFFKEFDKHLLPKENKPIPMFTVNEDGSVTVYPNLVFDDAIGVYYSFLVDEIDAGFLHTHLRNTLEKWNKKPLHKKALTIEQFTKTQQIKSVKRLFAQIDGDDKYRDEHIDELMGIHRPVDIKFALSSKDMQHVYEHANPACMSHKRDNYFHGDFADTKKQIHPLDYYHYNPNVLIAYVEKHGTPVGRTVVDWKNKIYGRVYCSDSAYKTKFITALENLGYKSSGYEKGEKTKEYKKYVSSVMTCLLPYKKYTNSGWFPKPYIDVNKHSTSVTRVTKDYVLITRQGSLPDRLTYKLGEGSTTGGLKARKIPVGNSYHWDALCPRYSSDRGQFSIHFADIVNTYMGSGSTFSMEVPVLDKLIKVMGIPNIPFVVKDAENINYKVLGLQPNLRDIHPDLYIKVTYKSDLISLFNADFIRPSFLTDVVPGSDYEVVKYKGRDIYVQSSLLDLLYERYSDKLGKADLEKKKKQVEELLDLFKERAEYYDNHNKVLKQKAKEEQENEND